MGKTLTIGAVAKRVGTRPSAIRFYERQGLLAPHRLPNGYRVYDHTAVDILRFIDRARTLGFSLAEVKQIVNLRRAGNEPCDCVMEMIERNVAAITSRIAELSKLRRNLRSLIKKPAPHQEPAAICPIIECGH